LGIGFAVGVDIGAGMGIAAGAGRAEGAGAAGWLVASALHDRRIPPVRSKGSGQ